MKQRQLFKILCECQDDNEHVCGKQMSKHQLEQDGMCSRCADGVWNYLQNDVPFIHKETLNGQASNHRNNQG